MNRWIVHTAVTIVDETGIVDHLGIPREKDTEVCQYGCEFPRTKPGQQMPERVFRQAFDEMREACLKKARAAGLIRD